MEALNIEEENAVNQLMSGRRGARADDLIRQGVPLAALDRLSQHGVDVIRLGIIKPRTLSHRRSRGEAL
ncbi:hypothetical protein [Halomonas aquatica]|uniref:Uncharacterized protein n=1 Tax=Halomonas aquatica TaxID=3151123 RepID=A0ABV1NAG0_9GAMM